MDKHQTHAAIRAEIESAQFVLTAPSGIAAGYDHAIRVIDRHLSASTSIYAVADLIHWQQIYERRMTELRELLFTRHPELRLRAPAIESIDVRRL